MPRVPDLIGRIRLDTRDLDRAKGEVDKFSRSTESAGGRVGSVLTSGLDDATTALTAGLGTAGVQAKATLDRIGTSALSSGSALKTGLGAGAVAGGLLLTKFATDGVQAFADLAEEVRDFRRASGASAEDASRFVAVFDDLQISSQAGATAIQRLGRDVAAGAPKLREFGIEVARNADGTSNLTETLLNVADAYAATPDQATRAAIGHAAFGRQARELVPLLDKGREGLEEFFESAEGHGQILSDEELRKAEEMRLAIDEMHDAIRGLQLIGAKALVPFITTVTDAAAKTFGFLEGIERRTGGLLSGIGRQIGRVALHAGPLGFIGSAIQTVTGRTDEAGDAASGATPAVDAFGRTITSVSAAAVGGAGNIEGWGDAASRVADQIKAIADSEDKRRTATLSVLDAEQASQRATVSFAAAVERVGDAERGLSASRLSRTEAARRALDAERALRAAENARSNVLDAERELERARAGRGSRARSLADAERSLRRAQNALMSARGIRALRDAQEQLAEAEERVADARSAGGREEDIRQATEALTQAQLDARSSALELAEAREESAKRQKVAEKELADARRAATDAAMAAARAAQELAERQAEASGQPFTVDDGYEVFRSTLADLRDQLAPGSALRANVDGLLAQLQALPERKGITVTADTFGVDNALGAVRNTVQGLQSDIDNAVAGIPPPTTPEVRIPVTVDTAPVNSAMAFIEGRTARTTSEVRVLGAAAFVPLGTSADDAARRVGGVTVEVGTVRTATREPLRLTADVTQPIAVVTQLKDLVAGLRTDTENVLTSLSTATPPLLGTAAATAPRTPATAPPTATNVTTNNVTVNALGANEDVARTINERLARETARAR